MDGNSPEWLQTHPEELRLLDWGWEMLPKSVNHVPAGV